MTKIQIPKVDVQKFLQKSIHGGFTMIFNKQLKGFDIKKDFSYYLDVNSLYPSVMATKKLPTRFVKWVEEPSVEFMEKHDDQFYFFAEVDIAPLTVEHQKKVSNYPLFPENFDLTGQHLSEDQKFRFTVNNRKTIINKNGEETIREKPFTDRSINTVTFFEKKNYVASWSYIKQALEVGYKVTKVHRIAMFEQDYVLKGYIEKMYKLKRDGSIEKAALNKKISETVDPVEKNHLESELSALESRIAVFKLILNAIYGQCIINSDRHSEVAVYDIDKESEDPLLENIKLKTTISSMRFKSLLKIEDKCIVSTMKSSYDLSYPLMLGSAILFESKLIMSKFVYKMYDWLQGFKDVSMVPLMTDTDSYVFHIKNIQQYFPKGRQQFGYTFNKECYSCFDTTGWSEEFSMPETHEALCHMKDETKGKQIIEFNGVAAKCYSFITEDGEEFIKGKGISKSLKKTYLKNKLYRDTIDGTIFGEEYKNKSLTCEFGMINSRNMMLYNTDVKKSLVTIVDLKSYYTKNGQEHFIYGSKEHLDKISMNH